MSDQQTAQTTTCPRCEGSGEQQDGKLSACVRCGGRGYVLSQPVSAPASPQYVPREPGFPEWRGKDGWYNTASEAQASFAAPASAAPDVHNYPMLAVLNMANAALAALRAKLEQAERERDELKKRDAYRQRWANLALTLANHNDHNCDWMFRELEAAVKETTADVQAQVRTLTEERDRLRTKYANFRSQVGDIVFPDGYSAARDLSEIIAALKRLAERALKESQDGQ